MTKTQSPPIYRRDSIKVATASANKPEESSQQIYRAGETSGSNTKPIMRCMSKEKFRILQDKYEFTTSMVNEIVRNAKNFDVLVLQTQFREGKHWIDNAWILNEENPEVFMELIKKLWNNPLGSEHIAENQRGSKRIKGESPLVDGSNAQFNPNRETDRLLFEKMRTSYNVNFVDNRADKPEETGNSMPKASDYDILEGLGRGENKYKIGFKDGQKTKKSYREIDINEIMRKVRINLGVNERDFYYSTHLGFFIQDYIEEAFKVGCPSCKNKKTIPEKRYINKKGCKGCSLC